MEHTEVVISLRQQRCCSPITPLTHTNAPDSALELDGSVSAHGVGGAEDACGRRIAKDALDVADTALDGPPPLLGEELVGDACEAKPQSETNDEGGRKGDHLQKTDRPRCSAGLARRRGWTHGAFHLDAIPAVLSGRARVADGAIGAEKPSRAQLPIEDLGFVDKFGRVERSLWGAEEPSVVALRTHRFAIQHQGFPEGKGARGTKIPLDDAVASRSGAVGGREWVRRDQLCVDYSITSPYIKGRMAAHIHTHTRIQKAHPYTIHNTHARMHTRVLTAGQGDRHIGKGHTEPAGHLFSRPVANRERVP